MKINIMKSMSGLDIREDVLLEALLEGGGKLRKLRTLLKMVDAYPDAVSDKIPLEMGRAEEPLSEDTHK